MVHKNDKNGNPVEGSIDTLIQAVRNGYEVRVSWGWQLDRGIPYSTGTYGQVVLLIGYAGERRFSYHRPPSFTQLLL